MGGWVSFLDILVPILDRFLFHNWLEIRLFRAFVDEGFNHLSNTENVEVRMSDCIPLTR